MTTPSTSDLSALREAAEAYLRDFTEDTRDAFHAALGGLVSDRAQTVLALLDELDEREERIDDLVSNGEAVSAEFEGDCWKAMRSLLEHCKFDWLMVDTDGLQADAAKEYLLECLDQLERDEASARARSTALEAERDAEKARADAAEAERDGWRCFHCSEVFTSEGAARLHFGASECSDPACQIKAGAEMSMLEALRRAEADAQDAIHRMHDESAEGWKAYHAAAGRLNQQGRAAEELGYERGLRDGRSDAEATIASLTEQLAEARERLVRVHRADALSHNCPLWIDIDATLSRLGKNEGGEPRQFLATEDGEFNGNTPEAE